MPRHWITIYAKKQKAKTWPRILAGYPMRFSSPTRPDLRSEGKWNDVRLTALPTIPIPPRRSQGLGGSIKIFKDYTKHSLWNKRILLMADLAAAAHYWIQNRRPVFGPQAMQLPWQRQRRRPSDQMKYISNLIKYWYKLIDIIWSYLIHHLQVKWRLHVLTTSDMLERLEAESTLIEENSPQNRHPCRLHSKDGRVQNEEIYA